MFKLLVQNGTKLYDLTESVTTAEWETNLIEQPGKLTFDYIKDGTISLENGAKVVVTYKNFDVFVGFLFKQKLGNKDKISATAYDTLRYLQNKDTYVFTASTSCEIFSRICKEQGLPHKIVHSSSHKIAPVIHDNKSYYEMIQSALDDTLINTGNWFIIRDNFGIIEHLDISKLKSSLFIGDESLLTGYDFEKSIDSDTFNQIKLVKDNKETKKREIYIVKDTGNINKWGRLQYFESMNEKVNEAQIKSRANMILKLKNRETKSLNLTCLGDLRVFAGVGIVIGIKGLKTENLPCNQYALVSSCTHKFTNDKHLMDLSLELV